MSALSVTASGERELVITRAFDAPRALVFTCLTTPALLERWLLGPDGWSLEVAEFDLRVGGRLRYIWRKPGKDNVAKEMAMSGTFVEVAPPERLVHTELFDEDWTDGEALATTVLTERDGGTVMTVTMRYQSRAARDGAAASGMETGMEVSYDRLDDVLATLDA